MNQKFTESKHPASCACGFCRNKGSFGKKKAGSKASEGSKAAEGSKQREFGKEVTAESVVSRMLDR